MKGYSTVWACNHVHSGNGIERLTNLRGFKYADCGSVSHFSDLTRFGTTKPLHSSHLSVEILSILNGLPACCSAFLEDGAWIYESFQDSERVMDGVPYCLTIERLIEAFPEFEIGLEVFMYFSKSGAIAVLNIDGVRVSPVWLSKDDASDAAVSHKLEDNVLRRVDFKDFLFFLSELRHFDVLFVDFERKPLLFKGLVLIDELEDFLRENGGG